ncbi:MAG: hypothetical protein ABSG90_04975 [Dehalococcoidia bacterium]|jgi:O-antigen/teichoic acid export membrane protein
MDDNAIDQPGRFETRAFGKDVLIYSAGSGFLLLFGFIQTLIIPKYLSVAGYGYWQLFMLYGAYVYFLNLGFNEGLLVRWAGKALDQIGSEIQSGLKFLVIEQLILIIPLGLISSFLLPDSVRLIGVLIFIYAFVMNMVNLFLFVAQATRQFRLLTILDVSRGLIFLAVVIMLFVAGHLEYQFVIVAWVIAYFLFMIALALRYRRYLAGIHSPDQVISFGFKNAKVGIFILLGGFVFVTFCSLDRLLVSSFFTIEQFAVYAFAMAVAQIAFTFIKAAADVLFPHLSAAGSEQRTRAYQLGKRLLIFCWAVFLGAYFPFNALINSYLPHYVDSLPILKILLGSVGFSSLILILQVNYYRLYRKQRQYFIVGIIALAFAFILALAFIKIIGTLESVAIAILIGFFAWYIVNGLILKEVTGENGVKTWIDFGIMGCYLAGFWFISSLSMSLILQLMLYIGFFIVVTWLLLRATVRDALLVLKSNWKGNN